eukprot:1150168-Pelagomonas_calceolata.AAC.8
MPPREHLAELGSERSEAQPNATQHDDGLKHLHRVYCCEGAKAQAQCGCGEGAQAVDADSHLEHRGQDKAHARSVQACMANTCATGAFPLRKQPFSSCRTQTQPSPFLLERLATGASMREVHMLLQYVQVVVFAEQSRERFQALTAH